MTPRTKSAKTLHSVTMADVGQQAGGYHHSTVSLALRNHPGISKAVRKLIQETAKQLGYRRDPMLAAFNEYRTQGQVRKTRPVIAFIANFPSLHGLEASAAHRAMLKGGSVIARMLHHRLEFFPLDEEVMTARRLDVVLHARGVEGLVFGGMNSSASPLDFTWSRYSTIGIEGAGLDLFGHFVEAAFLEGARTAIRRITELGYRRIGLVTIRGKETKRSMLIQAGVLCEQTLLPADRRVTPFELTETTSESEVRQWLCRFKVDAVLTSQIAWRKLTVLAGRVRMQTLGWACTDVVDSTHDVAGIEVDYEALGAVAVEQAVMLMRVYKRGLPDEASITFVPITWRDGSTLPFRGL